VRGNSEEQRDVDAVADQAHIGIVASDRQQAESLLDHFRSTGAVSVARGRDVRLPR